MPDANVGTSPRLSAWPTDGATSFYPQTETPLHSAAACNTKDSKKSSLTLPKVEKSPKFLVSGRPPPTYDKLSRPSRKNIKTTKLLPNNNVPIPVLAELPQSATRSGDATRNNTISASLSPQKKNTRSAGVLRQTKTARCAGVSPQTKTTRCAGVSPQTKTTQCEEMLPQSKTIRFAEVSPQIKTYSILPQIATKYAGSQPVAIRPGRLPPIIARSKSARVTSKVRSRSGTVLPKTTKSRSATTPPENTRQRSAKSAIKFRRSGSATMPHETTKSKSTRIRPETTRSRSARVQPATTILPPQATGAAGSIKADKQTLPPNKINQSTVMTISAEPLPEIGQQHNYLPKITSSNSQLSSSTKSKQAWVPNVELTMSDESFQHNSPPLTPASPSTSASSSGTENEVSLHAQNLVRAVEKKIKRSAKKDGRVCQDQESDHIELRRVDGNVNITINNAFTNKIYHVKTAEMMAVNSTVVCPQEPPSTDVCGDVNGNDDDVEQGDGQRC